MTTENDLYEELIEMADHQNVRYSLASSARKSVEDARVDNFRRLVGLVKATLNQMHNNNERVLELRGMLSKNSSSRAEKQINEETYGLTEQNHESITTLKKLLEEISKVVEEEKKANPDEPETLSKIYQKNHLVKEIDKVIRQCKKIQLLIESSSTNTVVKRIMMLDPTLDEKKAEEISKQKNGYEQFLKQKTLGKASQKLMDRVNDILQKDSEIKKLQKSIAENLVMMKQIAVLVQQQGEMIDNIEQNLLTAKNYVEKATQVLHKQKKQHQRSRKKMCCIILIGIIVLALIVVPIVVTQVKKNQLAAG